LKPTMIPEHGCISCIRATLECPNKLFLPLSCTIFVPMYNIQ
jgi:hypothetical protein